MMRIEDVVVKTILAGELHIASACKMFMPYPGNCFGKFNWLASAWLFSYFKDCYCFKFYCYHCNY